MATPVPATWADPNILTAAQMNAEIRDVSKFLLAPPQVSVYHNAAQVIANNVVTVIPFNSERYDRVAGIPSTMHDIAVLNSRVIPNAAGIYQVHVMVQMAAQAVAAGFRILQLRMNGGVIKQHTLIMDAAFNNLAVDLDCQRTWEMNGTTDFFDATIFQTSGGNLNVIASTGFQCDMTVTKVG